MLGFLRGNGGELRAGYQCAAKLGAWTATKDSRNNFVVDAETTMLDAYWIKKRPLMLRLYLKGGSIRWKWQGVDVVLNGKRVTVHTNGKREN